MTKDLIGKVVNDLNPSIGSFRVTADMLLRQHLLPEVQEGWEEHLRKS